MIEILKQQILKLKLEQPYHPDIRKLQKELDRLLNEQA